MATKPGLRFTRLRLTNWRNFRSVDLRLLERAFVIGPNASGKSNLLDALRFLAELAKPGSGGLQAAAAARGGVSQIRCLHARINPLVEIIVDIGTDMAPAAWRYELQLNSSRRDGPATVVSERVTHGGAVVLQRNARPGDDALDFSQTFLEQVAASKNFRELAAFLASCRYLHVVPQIVRDRERARKVGDDPFGGDLLRRMKDLPKKSRAPRLTRIAAALQVAVPQFDGIELRDDSDGVPHLYAKYQHWRLNASRQSEVQFSDGTLRLIGLMWSISERGGPLLLEEPELSLNEGVIAELPRMFARMQRPSHRQVLATTHSPALLDDTGVGLGEVHQITVDPNGSHVRTLVDDDVIRAKVEGGMSISEAAFPLLRPSNVEKLRQLELAV